MEKLELTGWPFDLATTLNSGQVFHWTAWRDGFVGTVDHEPVYLSQPDPKTLLCSSGFAEKVTTYLGLNHSVLEISKTFPTMDIVLNRAISYCPGIRIIKQPAWECLATFITSSLKQVPHIRQISLRLRERFGARLEKPDFPVLYAYPTPERLAEAGESALRECGLGYRAAFLHRTATEIAAGKFALSKIDHLPDKEAIIELCTLFGVGEKIASCALLFGWERHGVFPIDVWIERALRLLYFPRRRKLGSPEIRDFAHRHFGPNRGYAQQFLFHWARLTRCGELEPDQPG
jgi:N-glycosylase/DNA lyase